MSDIIDFKKMLDKAGYQYAETKDCPLEFQLLGMRGRHKAKGKYTVITVYGAFYDELEASFDHKGDLINLHSHVCLGYPETQKQKELLVPDLPRDNPETTQIVPE